MRPRPDCPDRSRTECGVPGGHPAIGPHCSHRPARFPFEGAHRQYAAPTPKQSPLRCKPGQPPKARTLRESRSNRAAYTHSLRGHGATCRTTVANRASAPIPVVIRARWASFNSVRVGDACFHTVPSAQSIHGRKPVAVGTQTPDDPPDDQAHAEGDRPCQHADHEPCVDCRVVSKYNVPNRYDCQRADRKKQRPRSPFEILHLEEDKKTRRGKYDEQDPEGGVVQ